MPASPPPTIPASSSPWSTRPRPGPRRTPCRLSIPSPFRCGACPSRSRTISTSPACRPPPPVPTMPMSPRRMRAVVQCLLDAGALLIGKTNLDQFATGLVGVRTPYPVPRNACDPALVPGGSSSGSAVAVARGLVTFALGTDTAGSGRVPAALNNIVGLKPSRGALSVRGVVPACLSLDCVSIFAATTDDAWRVMQVAAVPDPADPWSRRFRSARRKRRRRALRRAGLRQPHSSAAPRPKTPGRLRSALLPGRPVEVDLAPFFAAAALLYEGAWVAERYAAIRDFIEAKPESLHPSPARSSRAPRGFPPPMPSTASIVSPNSPMSRATCGRRSTSWSCRRFPMSARSTMSPTIPSAPIRASAPTPISSTCSISAPSPCPARIVPTAAPPASR